ncbi:MAG: hypothetical protein JNJ47_06160, partial [Alphaproteobacteria bacterium]|nr:hypothetical protein [Alphaproteobacteria bacterium]
MEKVGSFETMDNLNKEKIRITLLDIEEKLQINPSEFLKIPLLFQRDTSLIKDNSKTGSYRIEALKFLTYRGIVKSFENPKDGSDSEISSVLDAPRFIRFKEELEKIYGFGSQKKLVEEISSPVEVEVIGLPQKKSNHPATGSPVQDASVVENSFVEEITFEIVYTEKREVLVNEKYFTKTDLGGEHDVVLSYLMKKENQNRLVSMKEILEVLGAGSLKKSLRKIAENLKFKGVLLNAFFETSRGG